MKKAAALVVVVGVLAGLLILPAMAAPPPDKPSLFKGTITKVEDGKFVAKDKDGKKVTFTVDDKTAVTVDGKKAKAADLKVDMEVSVTPPKGTAQNVIATTAKK